MSTQLKKEFSPEDLQRARNIITGQTGNRTKITVGYEKKNIEHNEGDTWEENGKTWTIINGLKQTVTKHDAIRKLVQMPLVCPNCNKAMKADKLNTQMWKLHQQCFQCQIYFETSLRPGSDEKFLKYSRSLMNSNKNTHMDDLDQSIDAWASESEDTFISEDGHMENWVGKSVDPKVIKELKLRIKKAKETTL
tara:strand:- start:148 stop:726 length:579 start_codon:yes stop_codon:yes gene_type:complete